FLIYINDLPDHLSSGNYLFADDNGLVRAIQSDADREALQSDVQAVSDWCKTWGMRLNINKTKMMTFTCKDTCLDRQYLVDNKIIEAVKEMKCLDLTLSSTRTWAKHVDQVYAKCTRSTNFIYRVLRGCSMEARQAAYKSLVLPVAEYASTVWDTGE